jgi:inorganic pyrophosphatase
MKPMSLSLELALPFLGKTVTVIIDRPLGSLHPRHGFLYEANYGYVPNIIAPDGEELDAYVLGVNKPLETFTGTCIAIVHRLNDNDDKLVIVPENTKLSDEKILEATKFQEQFFDHSLLRA